MRKVTNEPRVIGLFIKKEFPKCRVMKHKLEVIARKHHETFFVELDAEKCPFLTSKLRIRQLPSCVAFVEGIVKDVIVGFEGLEPSGDDFPLKQLIRRLLRSGVCLKAPEEIYEYSDSDA